MNERSIYKEKRVENITMATHEEQILTTMSAILRRINMNILWKYVSICILVSMGFCIVVLFIGKFAPIPMFITNISIAIIGIGLMIGVIIGIFKRKSLFYVAIITDKALNLKDRLGSAIEIINKRKLSALAELQLEDTAEHIHNIDPKLVCPRLIPNTAYFLPVGMAILLTLWFIPGFYGEPTEVRQVIHQSGINIEKEAKEFNSNLSSDTEKLISKMMDVGKKLQEKNITKKEALRRISNFSREVEAMKMITEISNELKGELSPEKKRKLAEILEKLSELLKDMPEMSDLAQKLMKAQQMNLSDETLKELARALENRRLSMPDLSALQRMSDRLQKEKQDITKTIASVYPVRSSDAGDTKESQNVAGATGDSTPSKDIATNNESQEMQVKKIDSEGKMTELEGQLSSKGKVITTEIATELEKGVSNIPYEELYIKYKSAANDVISTQNIPLTYRNQVKAYFDAINPNRKGSNQ